MMYCEPARRDLNVAIIIIIVQAVVLGEVVQVGEGGYCIQRLASRWSFRNTLRTICFRSNCDSPSLTTELSLTLTEYENIMYAIKMELNLYIKWYK